MHRQWNQEHVSWEEDRDIAWMCSDGIRKAKAQMELNLTGGAKNNNKSFYRYGQVGQKRKILKKCTLLTNKRRTSDNLHGEG